MKNIIKAVAAVSLSASLMAANVTAAEYTIKLANVMGPSHDTSIAADKFAELVDQKSDGRIKVQHYPGGALGSDMESYQSAQMGMIDMGGGSFANLVSITRAFEVFHLPYIFRSRDEAHRALDSKKVSDAVNSELKKVGLKWLMTYEYGFRNINTVDQKVKTLADMSGLKLRTSRSPTEIAAIEAFGGSPITIDWPEVYNALNFGIVDGEAQPFGTMVSARHHEILKEYLENSFQFYAWVALVSQKKWDSYPEWVQKILTESAAESEAFHRKIWAEENEKSKEAYLAAGGKITTLTEAELQPWIKAGKSTWDKSGVSKDLIKLVESEAKGD
jgi:tripartite ATP-independent transporter DctP family solute receptor